MRDLRIIELASRQGGVVTRAQALEAGHTPDTIKYRVRKGEWSTPVRAVYRTLPARDETDHLTAAVTALPDSVVSHTSAARLLAISGLPAKPPTVTVHSSTTHRFEGVVVRRATVGVASSHRVVVMGLPTTSVARTLIDLAADLHPPVWQDVAETCVVLGRCTLDNVGDVARTVCKQGRPGSALVHDFLADAEASRSRLERMVAELLAPLGPEVQYPAPWDQTRRLDFAFPEARLAIEADGYRFHATRRRFDADRQRDRDALRAGWRIVRVTWSDIERRSQEVLATVVQLLGGG